MSEEGIIRSAQKSLRVLKYIMSSPGEVSTNELVDEFGYNRSTLHHMLKTMKREGFITQNQSSKNYNIGSEVFYGWMKDRDLREYLLRLRPIIEEIVDYCGETANIFIRENDKGICLFGEEPEKVLKAHLIMGKKVPLFCTAVGKAMLAFMPREKVERILKITDLKKYNKNMVIDKEKLFNKLEEIKNKGYALEKEEYEDYINALGIPLINQYRDPVAAISIVGPVMRFTDEKIKECLPFILEKTKEMSSMLKGEYYKYV